MKAITQEYFKVVKFFRVSQRKEVLRRNLTRDEAIRIVNSYPDRKNSIVGFTKQNSYSFAKKQ